MSDPRLPPVSGVHRLPGHDAVPVDIRAACDHAPPAAPGPTGPMTAQLVDRLAHVLDGLAGGIGQVLDATGPAAVPDLLRLRMGRDDYVDDSLWTLHREIAAWCEQRGDVSAAAVCERLRDLIRHVMTTGDLDARGPRS